MPQLAEGTLIGIIVVLGASLAYVVMPFITARHNAKNVALTRAQQRRDALVTHYERVLATIRDMDEDFNTQKLDETTYRQERDQWATLGTRILAELEVNTNVIQQTTPKSATSTAADEALDDAIESAIQQYLQAQSRN